MLRNPNGTHIRIDRGELSGAFGDIGTDLPLLAGMILASGLNPAIVLIVFGAAQIASALFYAVPMPVQPLKAVAALVIAGGITAPQILGAGLSIGLIMLALTATGLLVRLRTVVPKPVIRGIQLGLGFKLSLLALTRYIPAEGVAGVVLAGVCAMIVLLLLGSRRCPPALPVIGLGLVYALCFNRGAVSWEGSAAFALPQMVRFSVDDVFQGMILLALPQIPLSLGNSLFATHQIAGDLFPERDIKLETIGYTYSVLNIVIPFFGGVPVCHGSGGMAGHYVFGGRSGGSVLIYGFILLALGATFGAGLDGILHIFPLPVLGVILATEGGMLMHFIHDVVPRRFHLTVAALTATAAITLPYGFLIGLVAGTGIWYLPRLWPARRPTAVNLLNSRDT